jgi:uncharacterized membrane protein
MSYFHSNAYGLLGPGYSLFSPLLLIFFILFVIWLVRKNSIGDDGKRNGEDTALTILKRRYAEGKITKKQFLEMKKDIS